MQFKKLALPAALYVPADITTAVDSMQTDGVTIATAVVVAFFAVFTIKFLWRAK
jgi:hypothetical protein